MSISIQYDGSVYEIDAKYLTANSPFEFLLKDSPTAQQKLEATSVRTSVLQNLTRIFQQSRARWLILGWSTLVLLADDASTNIDDEFDDFVTSQHRTRHRNVVRIVAHLLVAGKEAILRDVLTHNWLPVSALYDLHVERTKDGPFICAVFDRVSELRQAAPHDKISSQDFRKLLGFAPAPAEPIIRIHIPAEPIQPIPEQPLPAPTEPVPEPIPAPAPTRELPVEWRLEHWLCLPTLPSGGLTEDEHKKCVAMVDFIITRFPAISTITASIDDVARGLQEHQYPTPLTVRHAVLERFNQVMDDNKRTSDFPYLYAHSVTKSVRYLYNKSFPEPSPFVPVTDKEKYMAILDAVSLGRERRTLFWRTGHRPEIMRTHFKHVAEDPSTTRQLWPPLSSDLLQIARTVQTSGYASPLEFEKATRRALADENAYHEEVVSRARDAKHGVSDYLPRGTPVVNRFDGLFWDHFEEVACNVVCAHCSYTGSYSRARLSLLSKHEIDWTDVFVEWCCLSCRNSHDFQYRDGVDLIKCEVCDRDQARVVLGNRVRCDECEGWAYCVACRTWVVPFTDVKPDFQCEDCADLRCCTSCNRWLTCDKMAIDNSAITPDNRWESDAPRLSYCLPCAKTCFLCTARKSCPKADDFVLLCEQCSAGHHLKFKAGPYHPSTLCFACSKPHPLMNISVCSECKEPNGLWDNLCNNEQAWEPEDAADTDGDDSSSSADDDDDEYDEERLLSLSEELAEMAERTAEEALAAAVGDLAMERGISVSGPAFMYTRTRVQAPKSYADVDWDECMAVFSDDEYEEDHEEETPKYDALVERLTQVEKEREELRRELRERLQDQSSSSAASPPSTPFSLSSLPTTPLSLASPVCSEKRPLDTPCEEHAFTSKRRLLYAETEVVQPLWQ